MNQDFNNNTNNNNNNMNTQNTDFNYSHKSKKPKKLIKIGVCMIGVGVLLSVGGFRMGGKTNIPFPLKWARNITNVEKSVSIPIRDNIDNIHYNVSNSIKESIYEDMDFTTYINDTNYNDYDFTEYVNNVVKDATENNFVSISTNNKNKSINNRNSQYIQNLNIEKFNDIEINVEFSNIEFLHSDNYGIEISYYEYTDGFDDYFIDYEINNGVLEINSYHTDNKKFGIGFNNNNFNNFKSNDNYIKIYIPYGAEFDNIDIKNDFSNLNLMNLDVEINNLIIDSEFGNVDIKDIISYNTDINMEFGNLNLGGEILNDTNITSEFGNVYLNPSLKENQYNYNCSAEFGGIYINNQIIKKNSKSSKNYDVDFTSNISQNNNASNNIDIQCEFGNVYLDFK